MKQKDNPTYFDRLCMVIQSVFAAEHECIERDNIAIRLQNHEITPDEYIMAIADEIISNTDISKTSDCS